MAKKKTNSTRDTPSFDYGKPQNPIELRLAKAVGEAVTLPNYDPDRVCVYLRKLIEVIEQGGGGSGTEVIANPTLAGTEGDLTGLQVGGTKYKVSKVVANPTLVGTETSLTGLEVNGVKYKAGGGGGGSLYRHLVNVYLDEGLCHLTILNSSSTAITDLNLQILGGLVACCGLVGMAGNPVYGVYYANNKYYLDDHTGGFSILDADIWVENDTVTQIL